MYLVEKFEIGLNPSNVQELWKAYYLEYVTEARSLVHIPRIIYSTVTKTLPNEPLKEVVSEPFKKFPRSPVGVEKVRKPPVYYSNVRVKTFDM